MVVCDVTDGDELELDAVLDDVPLVVAELVDDESSDSPDDAPALLVFCELEVAAADEVVVAAWPSCQAIAPPSETIVAMLRAVTALRARAARGLRRGRPALERGAGVGVGVGIGSSMTVTVRRGREWVARVG